MRYLKLLLLLTTACSEEPQDKNTPISCTPAQEAPYADGIPYLGIHADAGNSDVISCSSANRFTQSWHSLKGLGLTQPNTFSPDGLTTYATTSNPEPDGCRLHAIDTVTGETIWCKSYPSSIEKSAVEVDNKGNLTFTVGSSIVSLTGTGEPRWTTEFSANGEADSPWGVHFTPDGHIATVTSSGVVYLVNRENGDILSSLSIADTWNFVAPTSIELDIDINSLLPIEIQQDIATVWGDTSSADSNDGFSSFLGAGSFVDNTLAVSSLGRIYVIGGGPDEEHGALVQLVIGGSPEAPTLEAGWSATTVGGSASSPSVNRTATHVVIADGSSLTNIINPGSIEAAVRVVDIKACDENTDDNPQPEQCAFDFSESVQRSALPGAPAILDDGTVIFYEFGLDFSAQPTDRDVVALGPDGILWESSLPGNMDWDSVITVTDNHVIGTASRVTLSEQKLLGLAFPLETTDRLVILDRSTGTLVFKAEIPDDSSATVTVGPDGALYVGILGLLSVLSIDDRPNLGLVRFNPESD
jgi:hypothetical protein